MIKTGTLVVQLIRAQDLKNVEIVTQTQDPYCKLFCDAHSGDAHSARSKTHTDGGRNPEWNEEFMFSPVTEQSQLEIKIYDKNHFFKDVLIGTAKARLADVTWNVDNSVTHTQLSVYTRKGEARGYLYLGLKFLDLSASHDVKTAPTAQKGWVYQRTEPVTDQYELGKELGRGSYGVTRIATHKHSGKQYACKTLSKRRIREEAMEQDVRTEIQVMHHLKGRHSAIIALQDVFEDSRNLHIVMELCTGGELFQRITDKLNKGQAFTEKECSRLVKTMVEVVAACHDCGVVHRDIKPENFLFIDKSANSQLKAIDFGLGSFFQEGQSFSERLGSVPYMAPEVWRGRYGKECDIWSCGVILYILLSGAMPFLGVNDAETRDRTLNQPLDLRSYPWPNISPAARDCVEKMLVRDPTYRATAQQILQHEWIRENGVADDRPLEPEFLLRIKNFANANRWKKDAMRLLAASLQPHEIEGLRQMFIGMDVNRDGVLTIKELREGLQRKGGTVMANAQLQQLLQSADQDGSGSVDFEEFLTATVNHAAVREERLRRVFQMYDRDNSDTITMDELAAVLGDLEVADVRSIMEQVDKNKDGHIDFQEFIDMMRSQDA